ncbi:F-box domain containing protein [Tanacetum coccineum]
MSDNIPFNLQLTIMNRLPVKSLLQFRTVSKSWKYSIDCSDFVREYGFLESNNCCLYLTFKENFEGIICSVDDNLALSPVVSNLKFFNLTPFATSEGQAVLVEKIFWVRGGSEKFSWDDGYFITKYYMLVSFDLIYHQFSFKFVDFSIIYAWELQVDDGEVSWYRKLFTLPYPIEHDLKLIGFTKDKQPIVEASFV